MTSATAGSGMKWVGRAIRRLEDPALVSRSRPFHRRSAAKFCGALRPQPGCFRPHRPYRSARRRADRPRRRPRRRAADPADAAQVQLSADRAAGLGSRDVVRFVGEPVAAVFAPTAAEAEDIADQVEIEIAELPAVVERARSAWRGRAARPLTPAECRSSKAGSRRPDFDATCGQGAPAHPRRRRARTGRTRRRSKRAPRTPHSIRRPAGSR